MPHYHFSLSGPQTVLDTDGEDLENHASARRATLQIMAETLTDREDDLLAGERYVVEATDSVGRLVYRLTVAGDVG